MSMGNSTLPPRSISHKAAHKSSTPKVSLSLALHLETLPPRSVSHKASHSLPAQAWEVVPPFGKHHRQHNNDK
eukprot:c26109_g1_i1 orf=247-465(-)